MAACLPSFLGTQLHGEGWETVAPFQAKPYHCRMAQFQEDQNTHYYRAYYQFQGRSRWIEHIWSAAFGDQYPAGLEHYGYLTLHDLHALTSRLQLPPGSTLLDMGCGKGGPGLHLAAQLQFRLIGVDVIAEAIQQAREFKEKFDLAYPAQFEVGNFYEIPLPDHSVDAAISIDALWAAADKVVALRELKRVLRPGASVLFTFWDLLAVEAVPLLEQSGLSFISREDTLDWKTFQQRVYDGILAHEQELVDEMGASADMLLYEAKASPPYLDYSVRRLYEMQAP